MAWAEFVGAFAAFFLSHSIPVRPPIRRMLDRSLGSRGFTLAYSALSLGVLAWLIGAAARAPYVSLWNWAPWQNHFVLAVMVVVCLLLTFSIGKPNPFSFGGARNDRFDPDAPGIVSFCRHPLLIALSIWAFAHVLPNGDLAHVLLFTVFAGFAVLGQKIIDRRKQRQRGAAAWTELWLQTRKAQITVSAGSVIRFVAALLLYLLLIGFHPLLFGVSPLP